MTPEEAAEELLKRRAARRSFLDYVKYTMPTFEVSEHHRKMAEVIDGLIESLEAGQPRRIIVAAPPRHTKSEFFSRRAPTYFMGRNPDKQIINVTYSSEFAQDFGRDVRNIMDTAEYRALFPDSKLREDSRAANRMNTEQGGVYVSVGVGGPVTGRGAHCFPAGTKVLTENGYLYIEDIITGIGVLSCDLTTGKLTVGRVTGVNTRNADRLLEIETTTGRRVRATPDHKFFVPSVGWVEARHLQAGDAACIVANHAALRGVWGDDRSDVSGYTQKFETWDEGCVLQSGMQRETPAAGIRETVYNLWQALSGWAKQKCNVLFSGMHAVAPGVGGQRLPGMWECISSEIGKDAILRENLCRQGAQGPYDWSREFTLQRWAELQQVVSPDEATDKSAGRWMCGLRHKNEIGIPPYQRGRNRQQAGEHYNDVSVMPYCSPQIAGDTISSVKEISCGEVKVYDIRVEGTHCFFAEGILVHNCAIIDDPFKNRDDADSEIMRDRVWKWFTSTLYTRLMPGGSILVVATRWHQDDLSGRLLQQGGWELVEFAPEVQNGIVTKAVWPDWYPVDVLQDIKNAIGPRDWNALYMQNPVPDEGTFFQKAWFTTAEPPEFLNYYISTDFAVSADGGDYTELGVFGMDKDENLWVVDWWSGQETSDVWIDALLDLVKKWSPLCVFGETGVIRRSIEPYLLTRMKERKIYTRVEWITRNKRKAEMARPFQALAAQGKIRIGAEVDGLVDQLIQFPAGKHDDKVDACALMGLALQEQHPAVLAKPKVVELDIWGRRKRAAQSWKLV